MQYFLSRVVFWLGIAVMTISFWGLVFLNAQPMWWTLGGGAVLMIMGLIFILNEK